LRAYKQKKDKVQEVIRTLLLADNIEMQQRDAVWKALREFEQGTADFSDYLICYLNQACGASFTLTFDRSASQQRLFRLAK
jgi:predicted nucleic-acid-binding protein